MTRARPTVVYASLSSLVDYKSTLQQVARLAVPDFADLCMVDMLGPDGSLQRLGVAHADPAKAPLAEVMRYAAQLGSMTQGQGSYSMEFSHYDQVPGNVQQQIIAKAGKVVHEDEE